MKNIYHIFHKRYLLLIVFTLYLTSTLFAGELEITLVKESKRTIQLIKKAKNCIPMKKGGISLFCTGINIDALKYANLDFISCKNKIRSNGFKIKEITKKNKEYSYFRNSTKNALVLHKQKIVLLKNHIDRIDCIHELLHIEQRKQKTTNPLNPLNRVKRSKYITSLMEKYVAKVTEIEKKDKQKALKMSAFLTPLIKIHSEWEKLIAWLDEKEIYYFIYKNCESLNCNTNDKELALANLLRLSKFLPWRQVDLIKHDSRLVLAKKRKSFYKKMVNDFYKLKIKVITKENLLKSVFKNSLCQKTNVLYDVKNKKLNSFIDEYPKYCGLLVKREKLDKYFKYGIIKIQEYETALLAKQFWPLLKKKYSQFTRDESILYKTLNNSNKVANQFLNKVKRIPFKVIDDQILIHFNGKNIVFDSGAQDSLLKSKSNNNCKYFGSKTIKTPYGQSSLYKCAVLKPIKIGDGEILNFHYLDSKNLKINLPSILGLNLFYNQVFQINFLKNEIIILNNKVKRPKEAIYLQKNAFGDYDALEISCNKNSIRLDTGSQVYGDIRSDISSLSCPKLNINKNQILKANPQSALFLRDVKLNLGLPFIKKFKSLTINLIDGWIDLK